MNITEKHFKSFVKYISIILIFDYPIIPFILSNLEGNESCEYGVLTCGLLSLFLVVIIFVFWSILIKSHYTVFYTDRYKIRGLGKNDSRLEFFIKSFFLQKYFFNSALAKILIGGTTIAFSLGALYIFLCLSRDLVKLLF